VATLIEKQTRRDRKKLAKAEKIVGPEAPILAYGSGVGHARMSKVFIGIGIGFVVAFFLVLLLLGKLLIPGVLLVLVAASSLRPRRGVAITPAAVLVLHESMLDSLPNRVVTYGQLNEIRSIDVGDDVRRHVKLHVGPEVIRMKRSAYEALLAEVQKLPTTHYDGRTATSVPSAPPAWHSDPTAKFQYRYWDGFRWTQHVATDGVNYDDPLP
jgi:hypothetical protein